MQIQQLYVRNLRNLEEVLLEPGAQLNVIHGANGAGKTSLLEAIHLLLVGRSFRHHRFRPLVREGVDIAQIVADLLDDTGRIERVSMARARDGKPQVKLSGSPVTSLATLAALVPVATLDASLSELVSGSPSRRRQYLDWGLFHVKHEFFEVWRRTQRALRQRNEALRHGKLTAQISLWNVELGRYGAALDALRAAHFADLQIRFSDVLSKLSADLAESLTVQYYRGWPADAELGSLLDSSIMRDQQLGHTRAGPHRAELRLLAGGRPAAEVLSRGQMKLVSAALLLGAASLQRECGKRPLLLVDDLPAELDDAHRASLLDAVAAIGSQAFITCVVPGELPARSDGEVTMFHVKHGVVRRDSPAPHG